MLKRRMAKACFSGSDTLLPAAARALQHQDNADIIRIILV